MLSKPKKLKMFKTYKTRNIKKFKIFVKIISTYLKYKQ